jgi:hypothetical protein
MSTSIHQVLNLPAKGTAMSLGPVKIDAVYEVKQSSNGKNYRNISISDGSGKSKMSLWGASASLPLNKGDTVTFVGTLKKNEYNGTTSISTDNCSLAGGESAPVFSAAPSNNTPAIYGGQKLAMHELARQMATFTFELQEALRQMEIKNEIADQIVARAPEYAALWWFGERQLKEASIEDEIDPNS